eukprot:TRINITY_DN37450_c0_g1_i1.p1 TRINITY_DN37450_c0_g1~~TRINITY_DN37450_c0_g1_i1.p1  ORF type:complete len:144 (-),score=14.85 TRINITY_DN37450_c0_g1_i1:11-382(-)
MGLISIIPRSSSPGLQILRAARWLDIEEDMGSDEVLLFGGMTLARLTGIPALLHRVYTHGNVRFSAPFFQRTMPKAFLPASPGHEAELANCYNDRLRDASNRELRIDGSIVLQRAVKRCKVEK